MVKIIFSPLILNEKLYLFTAANTALEQPGFIASCNSIIITFRSENGSSSSSIPRLAFSKFIDNTQVEYNGQNIIINEDNYMNYILMIEIN